jgi:hypothetical protein
MIKRLKRDYTPLGSIEEPLKVYHAKSQVVEQTTTQRQAAIRTQIESRVKIEGDVSTEEKR